MKTTETITLDARAQDRLLILTHVLAAELDAGSKAGTRQVARADEPDGEQLCREVTRNTRTHVGNVIGARSA